MQETSEQYLNQKDKYIWFHKFAVYFTNDAQWQATKNASQISSLEVFSSGLDQADSSIIAVLGGSCDH